MENPAKNPAGVKIDGRLPRTYYSCPYSGCQGEYTTKQALDSHVVKCEYKGNAFKIRRPDKPEKPKKKEVGVAEPFVAKPQEKPQEKPGKSESVVANPPKVTLWLYCIANFVVAGRRTKLKKAEINTIKYALTKGMLSKKLILLSQCW
jgi:hypothetical protein